MELLTIDDHENTYTHARGRNRTCDGRFFYRAKRFEIDAVGIGSAVLNDE